jgi:hypothetical protein
MKKVRGLRNNNPLNIIKNKNIDWKGQLCNSTDPTFVQFDTMEHGLRAALCLLRTYYNKHGCRTVRSIVARWDPEGERVINAYVQTVCRLTGLEPEAHLPPMKAETQVVWCDIVLAMATMECGLTTRQREELTPYVVRAWTMM